MQVAPGQKPWGCMSKAPSLARGAEPPALKTRGGSWLPSSIQGSLSREGCQHLAGVCLLGAAASDTGKRVTPTADSALCIFILLFFFSFESLAILLANTWQPNELWFTVNYLQCHPIRGNPPKKKKSAEFVGSLVASATWPHLGRSWLTPLSPCLDDRDEQGSWETPNAVWSKVSLK